MKKIILFSTWFFCLQCYAQPGQLDRSFGTNGVVLNTGNGASGDFRGVAIQKDKKILVADYYRNVLCRYKANGTPDSTFGANGEQPADAGNAMAIQPDGKIILVGYNVISRYDSTGVPDKTFFSNGRRLIDFGTKYSRASSIGLQSDGKIVVAGAASDDTASDFAIARFNIDGKLDKSFSGDGLQITSFAGPSFANSVTIQKDGKILVAGAENIDFQNAIYAGVIARYNTNGSLDNTFADAGKVITNFYVSKIALQNDGKVVVVGTSNFPVGPFDFVVARFNANGSIDPDFNGDGKQITHFNNDAQAQGLAIQNDGKILVGGAGEYKRRGDVTLARYNNNGHLDSTFGNNGLQETLSAGDDAYTLSDLVVEDDKAYVTGYDYDYVTWGNDGMLLRYTLDESKTTTVQITDPIYNSGLFTGPATIHLAAKITTPDTGVIISKVAFYNGDTLLYTDNTTPYKYTWKNVSIGEYAITAKAFDKNGTITTSAITNISVLPNKPPFVEITNPDFDRNFQAPLDLTISASAYDQDPDGTISKVEFYKGSTLLYTDSVSPYTFSWHNAAVGIDSLIARVTDNSGLSTVSSPVIITVAPNTPPDVSIISPVDNQYFHGPATITINADAYDGYNVLSKVEFYNGSLLLNTDSIYPYTFTWNNVPVGSYVITAKATDNSGLTNLSAPVHIFVLSNLPPAVKLISPGNGSNYIAPAEIVLDAEAKDPDGTIKKVEFYAGDTLIGIEKNKPYERMWKHVRAGNYTITARATDDGGKVTVSQPINISVIPNQPPTVSMISPSNAQTFIAPATLDLEAAAADADGRVVQVSFYSGTTLLTNTEHKAPYTYRWEDIPPGTYNITAVAKDNLGAETTSVPITINVIAPPGQPLASSTCSAGIKTDLNALVSLRLAPNPARNILNINTTGLPKNKRSAISIISSPGVVVKTLQIIGSTQTTQLNVSSLSSGVYTIKIMSGDKVLYRQFVKM